jgi:hypothetical protein
LGLGSGCGSERADMVEGMTTNNTTLRSGIRWI